MPGSDGSALINASAEGFGIFGADDILLQGNTFDGQGVTRDNPIWDRPAGSTPDRFRIIRNTFRNFYDDRSEDVHSQAISVGYSTEGLIDGNTFENNGTTAHIFFTWWGETANASTSYPRNICVRNNVFRAGPNVSHYFDVNFRSEIPSTAGIEIERDASNSNPEFYGSC